MVLLDPGNERHIIERLRERVSDEIADIWVYEILKKINDYIPYNWRLGMRSRDFEIRVLGDYEATFIGDSVRCPSLSKPDAIHHIIRTVVEPGGFAIEEIPKECPTCGQPIEEKVSPKKIAARPNLYVFEHAVEDWLVDLSPLAVRQYEKINPEQQGGDPYEYHRLHPLYKEGIRKETFGWIRWYYSGKVEWGDICPEDEWRGKSFWATTEEIAAEKGQELIIHYNEGRSKYLHRYT